jgi:hypothetical protein
VYPLLRVLQWQASKQLAVSAAVLCHVDFTPLLYNCVNVTVVSVRLRDFRDRNYLGLLHSISLQIINKIYLILSGRKNTYCRGNTEALVVASKQIGLEVNADKTKCMVMSGDQNEGKRHSIQNDNIFFDSVEELKYLGTILTNQNSIQEEIKSRLNSGNACYHSVHNILSSSLLSRDIQYYNFACCFVWV